MDDFEELKDGGVSLLFSFYVLLLFHIANLNLYLFTLYLFYYGTSTGSSDY